MFPCLVYNYNLLCDCRLIVHELNGEIIPEELHVYSTNGKQGTYDSGRSRTQRPCIDFFKHLIPPESEFSLNIHYCLIAFDVDQPFAGTACRLYCGGGAADRRTVRVLDLDSWLLPACR